MREYHVFFCLISLDGPFLSFPHLQRVSNVVVLRCPGNISSSPLLLRPWALDLQASSVSYRIRRGVSAPTRESLSSGRKKLTNALVTWPNYRLFDCRL